MPNRVARPSFSRAMPTGSWQAATTASAADPDGVDVDVGGQRPQPYVVDRDRGAEEVHRLAVDDHPDVDELTAVDPGHGPQHGVLERLPTVRSRQPPFRRSQPGGQELHVALAGRRRVRRRLRVGSGRVRCQPRVRHVGQDRRRAAPG